MLYQFVELRKKKEQEKSDPVAVSSMYLHSFQIHSIRAKIDLPAISSRRTRKLLLSFSPSVLTKQSWSLCPLYSAVDEVNET